MGDGYGGLPEKHAGIVTLELQRRLDLISGHPPVTLLLDVSDIVVSQQLHRVVHVIADEVLLTLKYQLLLTSTEKGVISCMSLPSRSEGDRMQYVMQLDFHLLAICIWSCPRFQINANQSECTTKWTSLYQLRSVVPDALPVMQLVAVHEPRPRRPERARLEGGAFTYDVRILMKVKEVAYIRQ